MELKFFNRVTGLVEIEKVYGDKAIEWIYGTILGNYVSEIVSRPFISKIYGKLQNLPMSQKKIPDFIKKYNIKMEDFLPEENRLASSPYSNFNQFFVRRFRSGRRPFIDDPTVMPAFSEARYFGWKEVTSFQKIPVKGFTLDIPSLAGNPKWEKVFLNGPLLLARLCPVDYHRFHFPDDGKLLDHYSLKGPLHSVNPLALKAKGDILFTNERQVSILETKNFGTLAYIEVGATCVGKIISSKPIQPGTTFHRGEEKGYFLFGGSTVIVIGEKGRWEPSLDILQHTQNESLETFVQLGTEVATIK